MDAYIVEVELTRIFHVASLETSGNRVDVEVVDTKKNKKTLPHQVSLFELGVGQFL